MAYAYKRTLTVDHTQCGSSDSTNFPVLFSFTDTTMKLVGSGGHINNTTTSNGQTVCADLAFYSDSALTTKLNWEVEFYDGTAGTVIAWVQVGTLSHTADTVFYMAYDDASVTTFQGNVTGTWSALGTQQAVWHLPNGSTLSGNDSGSNGTTLTNTSASAAAGQIDGGASFNGSSSHMDTATSVPQVADITNVRISAWVKTTNTAQQVIVQRDDDSNRQFYFNTGGVTAGAPNFNFIFSTNLDSGVSVADGDWHRVTAINVNAGGTNTNARIRIDGVTAVGPTSIGTFNSTFASITIGYRYAGTTEWFWDGSIDEVVISDPISNDWDLAEYNNQKTSSTFLTVGSETPVGGSFTSGRSYFL